MVSAVEIIVIKSRINESLSNEYQVIIYIYMYLLYTNMHQYLINILKVFREHRSTETFEF